MPGLGGSNNPSGLFIFGSGAAGTPSAGFFDHAFFDAAFYF